VVAHSEMNLRLESEKLFLKRDGDVCWWHANSDWSYATAND
jgi:hypothetical protein